MSENEMKTLLLRMPVHLYERVKSAAAENRISMTKFICETLEGTESTPLDKRFNDLEKRVSHLEKLIKKK